MKTIKATTEQAINEAKIDCIRQFEEKYQIIVSDQAFLTNEQIWLQKGTATKCDCGETHAVEMILFTKYMSDELIQFESTIEDESFYSIVGVCEGCGEK
jgi:hypothetical protein